MYGPPEINELFLKYQEPEEIFPALEFLKERQPRSYLEVGSGAGVSLHCAMEAFGRGCRYRAIDVLESLDHSQRFLDIVRAYDQSGYDVDVWQGYSQKTDLVHKAHAEGPWDVIMVDADHSFRAALGDILNYSPALSENGALVMHDIDPLGILDGITKRKHEIGDSRHVWMAVRAFLPHDAQHEFVTPHSAPGSKRGIGVIEARALKHG